MDTVAKPPQLFWRNGRAYLRARVPADVQRAISADLAKWLNYTSRRRRGKATGNWKELVGEDNKPKAVIVKSLMTSDRRTAMIELARKQVELGELYSAVRAELMGQGKLPTMEDVERIARDWFSRTEAKQASADAPIPGETDDDAALRLQEDLAIAKGQHSSFNDPDERFGKPRDAGKLLIEAGFIVDEESPEFDWLSVLVHRGHVELAQRAIDTQNRDFGRSYDSFFSHPEPFRPAPARKIAAATCTLASLESVYVAERKSQITSPKTLVSYGIAFRVAKDVIGADKPLMSVSRDDWRNFVQTLKDLPPNYTKRKALRGLNAVEAANLSRRQDLPTLSVSTVQGYVDHVSAMLDWAVREDKITKNLIKGLSAGKDPVPKEDKRDPFLISDLRTLFSHPEFCGVRPRDVADLVERRIADFWAPLIGLFSSFRMSEILQMRVTDVEVREGIYCFVATLRESDGSRAPDKKLKTASSRRVVPVHSELIRIGFLQYCEQLRKSGERRLFPKSAQAKDSYYSTLFSKRFIRFLKRVRKEKHDFAVLGQTFHSLRHNFRDALRDGGVGGELGYALGGWAPETSADRYGSGFRVADLQKGIESLKYGGLDLSHLHWP